MIIIITIQIIITSILELLVTVQHSYMRHLLLDYLPHFVALSCTSSVGGDKGVGSRSLSSMKDGGDNVGPSWLQNDQISKCCTSLESKFNADHFLLKN